MIRSAAQAPVIDVGQVLDKYELLERVGQGGMAVVYRGLDRSLRREVAVKVLHRHLSDHQEARDRFEREAHAVAKLRHENILEIFDYSGQGSDESWIVTEFIEGMTLKQFVTDHPPQHPEVGAMIVTQVGRALSHAHAQGILHRDVKPENVMIRSDGVVKLMDFGISQMVDTQRLTVTGQLLGSPAYMSPEHVEGRPLDFRTDVFACGIVLYQLTVGRLPFEGKNPHEILKRIAECRFVDPRHASPRIGNELGRIILRAMARDPDDRFGDMAEMLAALDRYLDGSGIGNVRDELARFFQAPASYEMALKARLVDHLLRRARDALARRDGQALALELLDRVLAIDPANAAVADQLARLGKRRRVRTAALILVGVVVAGGGAWAARRAVGGGAAGGGAPADAAAPQVADGPVELAGAADAGPPDAPEEVAVAIDAGEALDDVGDAAVAAAGRDAGAGIAVVPRRIDAGVAAAPPDAGAEARPATMTLRVSPPSSEVRVGGGAWRVLPGGRGELELPPEGVTVAVRNDACCEAQEQRFGPEHAGKQQAITLGFLPGQVIARCDAPGATVRIDDRPARLGAPSSIPFGVTTQPVRGVTVEFVAGGRIDRHEVRVKYAQTVEVACEL